MKNNKHVILYKPATYNYSYFFLYFLPSQKVAYIIKTLYYCTNLKK